MRIEFTRSKAALAVAAALGAFATGLTPNPATAQKTPGKYVAGDFHNHTTCSDGSSSMQKLVKKSTDKGAPPDTPWGLDWFVQAGHGGNGNRNCTLTEDATLDTPAYPFIPGTSPATTWAASIGAANVKGNLGNGGAKLSDQANPSMWRWQSVQEYQYPVMEYLSALRNLPMFLGLESVVAGHEHASMAVITGQMPAGFDDPLKNPLPVVPGPLTARYTPLGNATAFAQWTYCFDRGDSDWSRGNTFIGSGVGNNWECSVPGSANSTSVAIGWNATAQKIVPAAPTGTNGHLKTVEAMKWMGTFHPNQSYYVPAHLERAGPFNPAGNNGYNVEHLRNFNNAAPTVAFGFETQPGHHASDQRGEYTVRRNTFPGSVRVDSVGGTTFGGTGVYGAQIGGVWDALLGEGRNWWFFGSSDWHNRGAFGNDDVRSSQDFFPGEYQRNFTMVRNGSDKLRPQTIVDGLRTGNTFVDSGQLIDRLAFIACASYAGFGFRSNTVVETLAVNAALGNTDISTSGCATMGEKLKVRPGAEIVVSIVVRDPVGTNFSPYSFPNPSLAQIGVNQPLNAPVLDHIDVIRGQVGAYRNPANPADYAGEWPRNWIEQYGGPPTTSGAAFVPNPAVEKAGPAGGASLAAVPVAAKNTTAALFRTFNGTTWTPVAGQPGFVKMTFRISGQDAAASQYLRLRGSNLPANVPYETDANGNPLPDLWTNSSAVRYVSTTVPAGGSNQPPEFAEAFFLRIPCTATGTNVPTGTGNYAIGSAPIDGCPDHLPTVSNLVGVPGYPGGYSGKMMALDVAAWADLWFYSNPIFIEVSGSSLIAGVR